MRRWMRWWHDNRARVRRAVRGGAQAAGVVFVAIWLLSGIPFLIGSALWSLGVPPPLVAAGAIGSVLALIAGISVGIAEWNYPS